MFTTVLMYVCVEYVINMKRTHTHTHTTGEELFLSCALSFVHFLSHAPCRSTSWLSSSYSLIISKSNSHCSLHAAHVNTNMRVSRISSVIQPPRNTRACRVSSLLGHSNFVEQGDRSIDGTTDRCRQSVCDLFTNVTTNQIPIALNISRDTDCSL